MEYRRLDEQVREEGKQEGRLEHAREAYNRMIKDGFSHEKAHWIAYGDEEKS